MPTLPAFRPRLARACLAAALLACATAVSGAEIGQVKTASGDVMIERAGASMPAKAGARLEADDMVRTGANGSGASR